MSVLEVIGVVAIGGVCVLVLVAIVNDVLSWWLDREMRRWPSFQEWAALEAVVRGYPWAERDRKLALKCFRKLRYKYGKRVE